ncbi:serine/threonine-protein kinase [Enhygromyxa salina]|nr:serine/threonine-protein kinase [Enhygromyxa salina]
MTGSAGAMFGRYVLVQSIGRGDMGEVWVAIDPDLDRKVALKLLAPTTEAKQPNSTAQLLANARAMAGLTHPHVVTIHDVGEVDGQLCIAMEYVDGQSLAAWLSRGPYSWQEALAVLRQAGAALAAAHDVGLVHRNFKPGNVMIDSSGRVRVLDFGLARSQQSDGAPLRYLAPEQLRGEPADARSDMFSFCVVLFEALYGARPFAGDTREALAAQIKGGKRVEIAAEERAPAWVHEVVIRGLAHDPNHRFDDMQRLLRAIERSPVQQQRRRRVIAATLVTMTITVGLVVGITRHDPCDAQAARALAWNPALEAQLRAQIDPRTPAGSLVSQRLSEGLERSSAAWAAGQTQLCHDLRAKRITPGLQAVRERCLQDRRLAINALTGLSTSGEDGSPDLLDALAARPYAGLRSLGDPARCIELGIAVSDAPARSEARAIARARTRLMLALAPAGMKQYAATELARVDEAADLDAADLEHTLLRGRLAAAAGQLDAAQRDLHAVARAGTANHHELAVRAWLALVEFVLAAEPSAVATTDAAPEQAERATRLWQAVRLLDYAQALTGPGASVLRSQIALLRGRLALALDQPALGLSSLDAAIERAELEPTRDPDLLAELLDLRAALLPVPQAAAADRARARAVRIEAFGPDRQ